MGPGLTVHVHDAYVDRKGILEPALLGFVSFVRLHGRGEVARGELMRSMAETVWCPTVLLPSQAMRWQPIDERGTRATLVGGQCSPGVRFAQSAVMSSAARTAQSGNDSES